MLDPGAEQLLFLKAEDHLAPGGPALELEEPVVVTFTDAERRAHVARIGRRGEEVLVEVGDLSELRRPPARGAPRGPGRPLRRQPGPFRAAGRFPTIPLTCGENEHPVPGAAGRVGARTGGARRSEPAGPGHRGATSLDAALEGTRRPLADRRGAARSQSLMTTGLDARLVDVMQRRGVSEPYAHQADAIERALAGEDVLVAA